MKDLRDLKDLTIAPDQSGTPRPPVSAGVVVSSSGAKKDECSLTVQESFVNGNSRKPTDPEVSVLNLRTTTSQKCAAVPRRARF